MDILASFFNALGIVLSPTVFLVIFLTSIVAIILGIIPAISGGVMCILILPFMFGLDPYIGMPILCALVGVSGLGGSMTSILLGIPGDIANAASVVDGFPMTRKGEGGRGLGLALTANVLGGIIAVVFSFAVIPILIPAIIAFKSPEMFLIIVLALLFLTVLTKGSRLKGLIAAGIGLLLANVGYQTGTGVARLTFGSMYLYEGIETATTLMAILAMPVLLELHATGLTIAPMSMTGAGKLSELFRGARELLGRHKWIWFRSSVIGYFIGILPALGATSATWIAYGHAKQTAKNPEEFGKGAPQGIIAPESAANACHAGDLLTTLAFGIPGSSIMVIFLAAFLLMGVQPGPKLILEHSVLCFEMLITIALANVIGGAVCFLGAPLLLKVTRISPHYLFAYLIPIVLLSTYVTREYTLDLIMIGIMALLGLFMVRFGFSAPAMILGFILGRGFEKYLIMSLDVYGPIFFTSPISIILLVLIFMTLFFGPLQKLAGRLLHREIDILED
jgi:putative tricarboxylic transport membrane protein